MKITKDAREDVRKSVEKAAKTLKGKVNDRGEHFAVEGKGWGAEVVVADGWAYVHGFGDLDGTSTNIDDTDELGEAIGRLRAAKEKQ